MIRLLDKSKISLYNYFYIFCMFIYAGNATRFARGLGEIFTIGNTFAMCITIGFFVVNRIKLKRPYHISILVFLLYAIVTSINNRWISPNWILEWLIWLTLAYGICQGFKEKLFVTVETVLYHLCVIALAFWVVYLISPCFIIRLVKTYEFSQPYAEECNVFANMIVYTVGNPDDTYGADFWLFTRNAGFAWEPGAFSCFACLGLFCNILRTNFKLRNRSLWVFLVSLLSSQSTTGFFVFLVMVMLWLILKKKYLALLILLPLGIMIFNLPFVKMKFLFEFNNLQDSDVNELSGSLGRLYSFQLNMEEFLRHPIIGLGGYTGGTWLAKQGYDVALISGIGDMLVYFGAVMTLLFIRLLVKSCKYIQQVIMTKNSWLLIVVIIGMMISYNLWKQPIFIAFWMFGYYASESDKPKKGYLPA